MATTPAWVPELARLLRTDRTTARDLDEDQLEIVEADRALFQLVAGPTVAPPSAIPTSLPTRPSITEFSPTDGSAGTSVTINGEALGSTSLVYFGVTEAIPTAASSSEVTAKVPAGAAAGPALIAVTTDLGTVLGASTFEVT